MEPFSGNYLKKLIGNSDIEDALKRLDKLTEEARMAAVQILRVRGITDNVLAVDNRVVTVNDRVARVVKGVDDEVSVVDGA